MAITKITPQPQAKKLAKKIGLTAALYLKREDLHPHGSHKGRSIPPMVDHYVNEGASNFCISSSGNAALAAIYAIQKHKSCALRIFVGKHIQQDKLERLRQVIYKNQNITIEQVDAPKRMAFQMDKNGSVPILPPQNRASAISRQSEIGTKNLRQSTDDTALVGYQTLADELAEIKNLAAVFIPTSSGTTAQGLYNGFQKHNINPQIHIIQTPFCHPMVASPAPIEPSVASAIVDKVGYRKEAVQKAIRDSGGKGWIATDNDIAETKCQIKETENLDISANSALSVAGLKLALKNNWHFSGPVVCILTGR